jgi:phage tail-like protein
VDANLQRLYQLAERRDWTLTDEGRVVWDASSRMLRLVGVRAPRWNESVLIGTGRRAAAPGALDRFGTHARVVRTDGGGGPRWSVIASGAVAGEVELVPPGAAEITDAVISDDVLYLAIDGAVAMRDLRDRWDPTTVAVAGGRAWRLAPQPNGVHVALVDGAGRVVRVGEVLGRPMRRLPHRHAAGVFRPQPEDPDPPRFVDRGAPPGTDIAALATSPSGHLAVLSWEAAGDARVFVRGPGTGDTWSEGRALAGARRPYSLAWLDDDRLAVLVALDGDGTLAVVYTADGGAIANPVGELYPLHAPSPLPFLHGTETPPHYVSRQPAPRGDEPRPLLPLSWPAFATRGEVAATSPIDGLHLGVLWHRLYLEAAIPPGSSVTVWLAATEDRERPAADGDGWFPHRFGDVVAGDRVPVGAWVPATSEVPYQPGMLGCAPRPGVAGLFTALVQRDGRRVRTLAGRYLWVRLEITGDGRATPELAALRVYAGRRGYAQLYLPELYREELYGPEGDAVARATPADFLDRFLGLFESVLTPLEDRIASAWLLTHPRAVPDDSVEWLASWMGFVFAADLPLQRRRTMLDAAWSMYQRRGTLPGLAQALDLATGGGVGRGEIVIVEDFRLRRTFATILGADLTEPGDPLMPGLAISGNSMVGETLILGNEDQRGFLALFDEDLVLGTASAEARDEAAIDAFFDRLAHRVTVLVHQEIAEHDLGLLRQVIALEAPAHVQVKVVTATERFRVAVSSLVGVDTYLAPKPKPRPVILDRSRIGVADMIERLPSLDPRLGRTS